MSAISVMSAMAGCAGTPGGHGAGPKGPGGSPGGPDEATRGFHVEQGRLGFDHSLQVRPSKDAAPHELHDGDTVTTGDRLRATVVTSEDAYLYLAFCARHELAIYPSQLGVRTTAGASKLVPEGVSELVVDGEPGAEVLYLIASRTELSLADPRLASKLAAADQGGQAVDCGASLDAEISRPARRDGSAAAEAPLPTTNVLRGQLVPKKRMPAHPTRDDDQQRALKLVDGSGSSSGHGGPEPVDPGVRDNPPADPDPIRQGAVVWYGANGAGAPQDVVAADADGVAVVRYRFTHVARRSSP